MPAVSVIIPNYNHGAFLEQRIRSVLNQTFQDFEIILLDDKSDDDSTFLLKKFRHHPKVKDLIINKTNSGSPFKQWEKGFDHAHGDYIWIAESDDYAKERFLQVTMEKITRNSRLGLVYAESRIVYDDGSFGESGRGTLKNVDNSLWENDFTMSGKDFVSHYMIAQNTIPNASAVLLRKSVLDKISLANCKHMKLAGDWYFWIQILEYYDIGFICQELNYFRSHSKTVRSRYLDSMNFAKESYVIMNYIKNHFSPNPELVKRISYANAYLWIATILKKHNYYKISKIIKEIRTVSYCDRFIIYRYLHNLPKMIYRKMKIKLTRGLSDS